MDDLYTVWDESIPKHWRLSVRKCECGQTLWWDRVEKKFHCLKPGCPHHKDHVREYTLAPGVEQKIIEFGDYLTIPDIAKRLKVPIQEIIRVLEREKA